MKQEGNENAWKLEFKPKESGHNYDRKKMFFRTSI